MISESICVRHSRVNEGKGWKQEINLRKYRLNLNHPVLCIKCGICKKEDDFIETIQQLRQQE